MTVRPFTGETPLPEEQLRIMYLGLPTKGRLVFDAAELELIDAALREDPDQFHLWCARAALLADPEEAIVSYSHALRIRPLSSHVLYNRGRKQLGGRSTEMAAADLAAAATLDPDEPWKWHFLGVALYFMDRYSDAVDAFEQAVVAAQRRDEPLLPFEIEWIWNCHMKAGEPFAAREAIERVDERTPVLESETTYKRRVLLYRGLLSEQDFLDGIDRGDVVEAANQLYGYANFLHYLRDDLRGSVEVLREVLALTTAGWGAKMAAIDLPIRAGRLARAHNTHDANDKREESA